MPRGGARLGAGAPLGNKNAVGTRTEKSTWCIIEEHKRCKRLTCSCPCHTQATP